MTRAKIKAKLLRPRMRASDCGNAIYCRSTDLDGGATYLQVYPPGMTAPSVGFLWSVIAVDAGCAGSDPRSRYLVSKQSVATPNRDGSISLAFAPSLPGGIPEGNWLRTEPGRRYDVMYRIVVASRGVVMMTPSIERKRKKGSI